MERLLRLPQVRDVTGLGRSTIYNLIAEGKFPKPIKVTERATAWPASSVQDFIQQRIAESRKTL